MDIDQIRRYVRDAHLACQACLAGLGVIDIGFGLSTLVRAAGKQEIDRRGEVTSPDGAVYSYHIHGGGYSFKDLSSGKETHFDVKLVDGVPRIHFGTWKLQRYATSVGEPISQATVASELRRLSAEESSLVHFKEGPFEYWYWVER
jgi:hypothetical protein